jgi:hypothetical protein
VVAFALLSEVFTKVAFVAFVALFAVAELPEQVIAAVATLAVFALVAFPFNAPTNVVAVSAPVFGTNDNFVEDV